MSPAAPFSLRWRCLFALLAGVMYALAFPPTGWRWLIIPGVAGLFMAIQDAKPTVARGLGFLHGMTAFTLGLPWLYLLFNFAAGALWAILAVFTTAFAAMQSRATGRGLAGWTLTAFTVVNWCGWEFIRCELFPLKFPWMTPGLAVGPNALLPWTGVYGVSAVVVFGVMTMTQRKWKTAGGTFLLLSAAVLLQPKAPALSPSQPGVIPVAGIQHESVSISDYIKSTKALPAGIRHVVWPEYAVPYDVRANTAEWASLLALCKESNITLTLGTQTVTPGSSAWFNTALTLDQNGPIGEHHKAHPVHFFNDGTPGITALPVRTPHGTIGTPICFDCDYEGIVRKMTAAGAEVFLVPMMDAMSWSARQHVQHAGLFRIRACENARWFLVVGTSGVSQIIDPHGQVHGTLGAMEQGVIEGLVKRETTLTPYTRRGWLLPWFMLGCAGIWWAVLLFPHRAR